MADFRLGRLKFNWRGDWAADTAYVIDDIVKFGANTYVAVTNHTSVSTAAQWYSMDASYWQLHTEGIYNRGDWAPNTFYRTNDIAKYGNVLYLTTVPHTSTSIFNSANFSAYLDGLKFEDTYSGTTEYQKGDIVTFGGYSYICIAEAVTGQQPNIGLGTSWEILTTGFKVVGNWDNTTTYVPGDVVLLGGNSYVAKVTNINSSPAAPGQTDWDFVVGGFTWRGTWDNSTVYFPGDAITRNSNSYICIAQSQGNAPELDTTGQYWNSLAQGAQANVLTDAGDILYQSGSGPARLPIGSNGEVLTVDSNTGYPTWKKNNVTQKVYYVTQEGSDTNTGENITEAFATLRYAVDNVTGPATIYVKAGSYQEILPMRVPEEVSIVGDNLRTTRILPRAGEPSTLIKLDLQQVPDAQYRVLGSTVVSGDGSKTGEVLDVQDGGSTIVLKIQGFAGNRNGDAYNLLTANSSFIVKETIAKAQLGGVTITNPPNGDNSEYESVLTQLLQAITANVGYGGNDVIYDKVQDQLDSNFWNGSEPEVVATLAYMNQIAYDIINNVTVNVTGTHGITQIKDETITNVAGGCTNIEAAIQALIAVVTTGLTNGDLTSVTRSANSSLWTVNDTFEAGATDIIIQGVEIVNNEHATMFLLGNKTMLKDLVMDGLLGFVPSVSDPKDMNTATVKGVYVRLDPNSPITKSPYVSQCSSFGATAVGAIIDGDVHAKWDGTGTPSNKSIVFDSWTQIYEDGGVGFWVTNNGASEIVSCFTYYAHISYASTRGGRIRSLAGNSSWGTYAIVSSGFNQNEQTLNGTIDGLQLEYDVTSLVAGPTGDTIWSNSERIIGLTSGAIGEIVSVQAGVYKILYRPLKGTFVQGEVISGQTTNVSANLVSNTDAVGGQNGFVVVLTGLSGAPKPGGSIEFITGPGGLGEEIFTFVVAESSYTAPIGRGNLTVTRGLLGSAGVAHNGLELITRYQYGDPTTLSAAINNATEQTIFVSSISGFSIGAFLIIEDEMMAINSFPTATSMTVTRGVEGTTAAPHNSGLTVRSIEIKVVAQTDTLRDIDGNQLIIRVSDASGFNINDYIKIDNEFMQVTNAQTDTTGTTLVVLAAEKPTRTYDGQAYKIRYSYSQVRLTGHDFLNIGTGTKTQTNWPGEPLVSPAPGKEVTEDFPGRVFFVSTDQDGNFTVGRYFRVNQATGSTTLNASSFDLSGLSSLRLGSIGAQLGESITEFSSDVTLSANSNSKVPTQRAVKTYVDSTRTTKGYVFWAGSI